MERLGFVVWGLGFGVRSFKVNEIEFVQKVQCVQWVQKVDFRLPMLVFSPIISVRLSSLHLSGEGMGVLCVFAPLRALRETN